MSRSDSLNARTLVDPVATTTTTTTLPPTKLAVSEMPGAKPKNIAATLKRALESKVAICCYIVVVAAALGIITAYFLVVPMLQQTCTIFDTRCVSVMVTKGPVVNGVATLLVQVPTSGYSYYYDGRYIYSYGNGLNGQCPSVKNINDAQTPPPTVETVPLNGAKFCAHVTPDGACAPLLSETCSKWATYDPIRTQNPVECRPGIDANCVCSPAKITVDGDTSPGTDAPKDVCTVVMPYTCDGGITWSSSPCCDTQPACQSGQTCTEWSTSSTDANGKTVFTCPRISSSRDYNFCCQCASDIKVNLTPLTTSPSSAAQSAMEPVFAVDATTMELLPANNGIYCAKKLSILINNDFKDQAVKQFKFSVPTNNNEFNIYQVFEILKKKNIFKVA